MESMITSRKVVIIGAGAVGSSFAYALAQRGIADEITLTDINREYAEGVKTVTENLIKPTHRI